jgi:two-component system phosphate regulon response regulator PhoB
MPDSSTILLVDDEDSVQKLLAYPLERDGFRVLQARDGQEALDRAMVVRPDVVLLDLMLPRVDGYEVARRLRADPATRRAWIVAVTAHGDAGQAIEAGCNQVLFKPIAVEDLVLVLRAATARARRPRRRAAPS